MAPPKNKKKETFEGRLDYKRATPPGFEPHPTDHVQFLPSSAGIGPKECLPEYICLHILPFGTFRKDSL